MKISTAYALLALLLLSGCPKDQASKRSSSPSYNFGKGHLDSIKLGMSIDQINASSRLKVPEPNPQEPQIVTHGENTRAVELRPPGMFTARPILEFKEKKLTGIEITTGIGGGSPKVVDRFVGPLGLKLGMNAKQVEAILGKPSGMESIKSNRGEVPFNKGARCFVFERAPGLCLFFYVRKERTIVKDFSQWTDVSFWTNSLYSIFIRS